MFAYRGVQELMMVLLMYLHAHGGPLGAPNGASWLETKATDAERPCGLLSRGTRSDDQDGFFGTSGAF